MKKSFLIILIFFFITLVKSDLNAQSYSLPGSWEGKLSVSGVELRIIFHIESNDDGGLSGTLDSPDQNAYAIACGEVTVSGESVTILVPQIGGKYAGSFADQKTIEGTWSQGPANLPLDLAYTEEVEELDRPQEPIPPYPYEVRDVTFENTGAGVTLAGTLSIPEGPGPFTAAVLVSGSGPQDRDENVFGHKPFLVIADYLARNGIAVLRYDDRGVGSSTGQFGTATSKDFSTDTEAALEFLKGQAGINTSKIGIIGHSEGGLIAPMVASRNKEVGFIILLAGPGLTGEKIIILQSRLISEAEGSTQEELDRSEEFMKNAFALVKKEKDQNVLTTKLEMLVDDLVMGFSEEEKEDPQNSKEAILQRLGGLQGPWFNFFLDYDPVPALIKVKCPVLALNGEKDLQVPPKENLTAIENALKKGKNKNYEVVEMKGLNHLFQHSESGAPSEYGEITETFSEEALKLISDWIKGI